jgi:hypothetical protein
VIGVQRQVIGLRLEFVGEDIEQDLGIGVGVDVPTILAEQIAFQRVGVRQVAVVCETDAIRGIDVEGLRLGRRRAAGRRLA